MIKFSNWNISAIGQTLGRQYDNLTRSIDVIGDLPDGWVWAVLLEFGENLNVISLTPGEIGLHADLTADMLAFRGDYRIQLRGTDGVKVRHTNIITVAVSESISGDEKWPEVPSEFTQMEQRVQVSVAEAQASAEAAAQSAQGAESAAQDAADQTAQQLQGEFEALAQEASDSAQSAETSAQAASTAAGSAAQSASAAGASANQAASSTRSAAAASAAAAQSEYEATAAAGAAQGAATQAQQSAEAASQQAQTAGDHAADADQSAKSAADAQASAETAAGNAETAAGNAEQSANAAAQSAQEAQKAASVIPPPTPESAGMLPFVNAAGDGYVLSHYLPYEKIVDIVLEEDSILNFSFEKYYRGFVLVFAAPNGSTLPKNVRFDFGNNKSFFATGGAQYERFLVSFYGNVMQVADMNGIWAIESYAGYQKGVIVYNSVFSYKSNRIKSGSGVYQSGTSITILGAPL